jgi:hypothetical protein
MQTLDGAEQKVGAALIGVEQHHVGVGPQLGQHESGHAAATAHIDQTGGRLAHGGRET